MLIVKFTQAHNLTRAPEQLRYDHSQRRIAPAPVEYEVGVSDVLKEVSDVRLPVPPCVDHLKISRERRVDIRFSRHNLVI